MTGAHTGAEPAQRERPDPVPPVSRAECGPQARAGCEGLGWSPLCLRLRGESGRVERRGAPLTSGSLLCVRERSGRGPGAPPSCSQGPDSLNRCPPRGDMNTRTRVQAFSPVFLRSPGDQRSQGPPAPPGARRAEELGNSRQDPHPRPGQGEGETACPQSALTLQSPLARPVVLADGGPQEGSSPCLEQQTLAPEGTMRFPPLNVPTCPPSALVPRTQARPARGPAPSSQGEAAYQQQKPDLGLGHPATRLLDWTTGPHRLLSAAVFLASTGRDRPGALEFGTP
ncbi:basic salivary proline-rich protein 4-like [Muntiacus reevesi]|uniref:basic salivary proline-rich protein 4-like n=1 Tax=Muntiacus reevesi TaxID=9886 RepID=UPI003306FED9